MKIVKIICLLSIALLSTISYGFSQTGADRIIGLYWSPKKDAKIEMYKRGAQYYGKTVWAKTPGKDLNNPDKKLAGRNLVGTDILSGFTYEDEVYKDGQVYDPNNGKTYSCKISFAGNDMKVRGYIGVSLFGRTEIFQRIK